MAQYIVIESEIFCSYQLTFEIPPQVHVFNSHFSLSHEAREVAVKQIQEYMNCFDGRLVLLMGDLNATPKETAIRYLLL